MNTLARLKQPQYLISLLVIFLIAGWNAVQHELLGSSAGAPIGGAKELTLEDLKKESEKSATSSLPKEMSTLRETPFTVVKVIDGDTIVAAQDGKQVTVRLIGINAPETGLGSRPLECFGHEATEHLRSVLPVGTHVALDTDSSQGTYDKYNRVLAYVMLADHTNIGLLMIMDGYAYEYKYNSPYLYSLAFKEQQGIAKKEKKGLWADGACGMKNI